MKKSILLTFASFTMLLCSCEPSAATIKLIPITNEVQIHTELQKSYLEDSNPNNIGRYAWGKDEQSKPQALELKFESNVKNVKYEVMISETEDFTDSYSYFTDTTSVNTYNYKIGTKYYWKVKTNYKNKAFYSDISSFTIENIGPRNLNIEGVTNCRDCGGYSVTGQYNTKIKQGLLYRTGRLNINFMNPDPLKQISDNGIDTMLNQLKVKTEIDLRRVDNNEVGSLSDKSVLGDTVNYVQCPMRFPVSDIYHDYEYPSARKVFETLSKKENYPVFFHCSIGTDRTGITAFLVSGLLGMSLKDINVDYLYSNFGNIGTSRSYDNVKAYRDQINPNGEANLQQDVISYLINDVGVTQEQINSIQDILLEK